MITVNIRPVTKFRVIKSEATDNAFSIETVAECDTEEKAKAVQAALMGGLDIPVGDA